jgi:serine phosphatase RsbU (regulator of sigma subunit)
MTEPDINSPAFRLAELRAEITRVSALLAIFATLLALILVRALLSVMEGRYGEAWPFVVLLTAITGYELWWRRFIAGAIASGTPVGDRAWIRNTVIECAVPTAALLLQGHASLIGPRGVLTSPVTLSYVIFTLLSTLHLNPALSRMSGLLSALGYILAALYVFIRFPEVASNQPLVVYGTSLSITALLAASGYAAAEVALQIRMHVIAALREGEARARFERDLGIAREIQRGLLPKAPPEVAGFEVAGWNQPADETGGDYYDWQSLPDGRLAVTIADVTGHGIGPALGMAGCRAYARAGFVIEPDLRNLLGRLNRLLYEDLPTEKFVTLAAGVLQPGHASMQLISAGHGPLIFYSRAEDRFITYEAQGPPLGLLPRFPYRGPETLEFRPGDMLILITDGFIEWENAAGEDFGQNRLEEAIRANRDRSADSIISELRSAVSAFVGPTARQPDDLTALIVKRALA